MENFKIEPHIGDIEVFLSLGKFKYNTQICDDPTIQHVMWGDSSELKIENNKVLGSDGLHVRNKLTLDDENLVCLRSHIWIHSLWCRLYQIYILYLEPIILYKKGRSLMLITWMVIPRFGLPRRHLSHTVI